MILLDSNIVIYLRDPKWGELILRKIDNKRLATCNMVVAEVLGFKGLERAEAVYFEQLFVSMKNQPFDDSVTNIAIRLRRSYAIQLPDAVIAATAIANNLELWTHNSGDFEKIAELRLFDPLI